MQQPKVSVLISFYNLAPYVDQTMESVLAQKTDFPVEILCADDGSEDGTVELLRGWEKDTPTVCGCSLWTAYRAKNMRAMSASSG